MIVTPHNEVGTATGAPYVSRPEDGMLHGLVTWVLSTLFVVLFLVVVFGSLLGSTWNGLGYGAAAAAPQVALSGTATSAPVSEGDIRMLINSEARTEEALIDTLTARTKMSRAEATQAQRTAGIAVDKTAEALAHVMLSGRPYHLTEAGWQMDWAVP